MISFTNIIPSSFVLSTSFNKPNSRVSMLNCLFPSLERRTWADMVKVGSVVDRAPRFWPYVLYTRVKVREKAWHSLLRTWVIWGNRYESYRNTWITLLYIFTYICMYLCEETSRLWSHLKILASVYLNALRHCKTWILAIF